MLIIRVELHSAITGKVTEIARMLLWNDGTGDVKKGSYMGKVVKGTTDIGMSARDIYDKRPFRSGSVKDYPRTRLHVWNLVARMLGSMGYR